MLDPIVFVNELALELHTDIPCVLRITDGKTIMVVVLAATLIGGTSNVTAPSLGTVAESIIRIH